MGKSDKGNKNQKAPQASSVVGTSITAGASSSSEGSSGSSSSGMLTLSSLARSPTDVIKAQDFFAITRVYKVTKELLSTEETVEFAAATTAKEFSGVQADRFDYLIPRFLASARFLSDVRTKNGGTGETIEEIVWTFVASFNYQVPAAFFRYVRTMAELQTCVKFSETSVKTPTASIVAKFTSDKPMSLLDETEYKRVMAENKLESKSTYERYEKALQVLAFNTMSNHREIIEAAKFTFDYRPVDTYNMTECIFKFLDMVAKAVGSEPDSTYTLLVCVQISGTLFKNGFSKNTNLDNVDDVTKQIFSALQVEPKNDDSSPSLGRVAEMFLHFCMLPNVKTAQHIIDLMNSESVLVQKGYTADRMLGPGYEMVGDINKFAENLGVMMSHQQDQPNRLEKRLTIYELMVGAMRKRVATRPTESIWNKGGNMMSINRISSVSKLFELMSENFQKAFFKGFTYLEDKREIFGDLDDLIKFMKQDYKTLKTASD